MASVYVDSLFFVIRSLTAAGRKRIKIFSIRTPPRRYTVWEIRLHSAVKIVVSVGAGGSFHSVSLLPPLSISLVQTRRTDVVSYSVRLINARVSTASGLQNCSAT